MDIISQTIGTTLNRYYLAIPSCSSDLDVENFEGLEYLSTPYHYTIRFTSTDHNLASETFLNKPATFTMGTGTLLALSGQKVVHGMITWFQRISGSEDEAKYQIIIEPFLSLLNKQFRTHRFFINKTVPEVVEQVLQEHRLEGWEYEFALKQTYPQREQINQYQESDLEFIERLLAEVGIFYFFSLQPDTQTEVVHFADDQSAWAFGKTLPLNSPSGTNDNAADCVWGIGFSQNVVQASVTAGDYNHREAQKVLLSAKADATNGEADGTTYGDVYHYRSRHLESGDKHSPSAETGNFWARLEHERFLSGQTRVSGKSNDATLSPAQVLTVTESGLLPTLPSATENGLVIIRALYSASRSQALSVIWSAVPYSETWCWRPHAIARPVISGTLMARVTSAKSNDEYAHLNQSGLYWVKFDADRDDKPRGYESMPVRLAKPYGGDTYGMHFPLIQGTEVAVAFHEGDPDRPYIAHALHDSRHPDHVTSDNNTRNVIRTAGLNKLRMEDKRGEQHIKLSTEYGGKTQLNLGHNVDASRALRGEGAELRTDDWVSVRGGKGIFLSADSQPKGQGEMLAMDAALALLAQAQSQMESLSQSALAAQAQLLKYEQQQKLMDEKLSELRQAVILASAPEGMAIVSGGHLQAAAANNIFFTAGKSFELGAGANLALAASKKISLFTETEGIEAIAAKGDINTQAQSGHINTIAKGNVSITSASENITLTSAKTLTLNCAGGAYIRLAGENIEMGCPGDIILKQSKLMYSGPSALKSEIPELPEKGPQSVNFMLLDALGNAAPSSMTISLFDSENRSELWKSSFVDGKTSDFEQPDSKDFYAIAGVDKWTSIFSADNSLVEDYVIEDGAESDEHGPQFDDVSTEGEDR